MFLTQSIGFMAIIGLSWFDELVDLRSLVLGDHPYISDFRESTLEMLFVLVVWFIVFGTTRRILARMRHLEGFMRVCGWCRRIHCSGRWLPLEQFFLRSFETKTSHGICDECLRRQESALDRLLQQPMATETLPGPEAPASRP